MKKALDLCDGSLREAKDLYGVLNEIAKNLDGAVKEKVTDSNILEYTYTKEKEGLSQDILLY